MRTPLKTAAVAAVLALAGCGGSTAASGASPPAPTVAQVATRIGATNAAPDPSATELYTSHEGTATWHGQQVTIDTFATDTLRDNWEKIARQFGPILADGPGYAITPG